VTPLHNTRCYAWILPALMAVLFLITGCGFSSDRYHPHYPKYAEPIRTVLLLTPQIAVFQENPEERPTWQEGASSDAVAWAEQAAHQVLVSKGLRVHSADRRLNQQEIRDIQTLYVAVNRSIQLHTYGPQIFPGKLASFEYGLGSVADLLTDQKADALLLIAGHQTLSENPKAWISIAAVEPTGNIIWYTLERDRRNVGMTSESGVLELVHSALRNFLRSTH
jgi:hypothetical protein